MWLGLRQNTLPCKCYLISIQISFTDYYLVSPAGWIAACFCTTGITGSGMAPLKSRTNGHQVTINLALAKFALGIKKKTNKTNLYHVESYRSGCTGSVQLMSPTDVTNPWMTWQLPDIKPKYLDIHFKGLPGDWMIYSSGSHCVPVDWFLLGRVMFSLHQFADSS